MKPALVAFLLSIFFPGAGHLYAGSVGLAVTAALGFSGWTLAAFRFLSRTYTTGAILVVVWILLWLGIAVHAAARSRSRSEDGRWYQRWYVCIAIGMVCGLCLSMLVSAVGPLETFTIGSSNMRPTLLPGDRIVAAEDLRQPERGDIVVVRSPERPEDLLIERIVAIGGDVIEIRDKQMMLNGQDVSEPWAIHIDSRTFPDDPEIDPARRARDQLPAFRVPEDHVFVLGDNRDASRDSRFFGPVPTSFVVAVPLYIYWSPESSKAGTSLKPESQETRP